MGRFAASEYLLGRDSAESGYTEQGFLVSFGRLVGRLP